jgi:uncharacterized protein involved in type VI secretion and phage assembly
VIVSLGIIVLSVELAPVRRSPSGRARRVDRMRIREGRRAPRRDRIRRDGDPDLATSGRSRTEDFDDRRPDADAEHQSERQKGKLARGHAPQSSSAGRDPAPVGTTLG